MISNQQVIEQAKSVLTPILHTSKEDYFRIDTTLKHMIEYTHVWNDADTFQATAYRFLECWCYIYPELFENIKVRARAIGIELSAISPPDWYIDTYGTVTIEHLLTFTANDKEVSVWVNFKGMDCIHSWARKHSEEVVPDYDAVSDFIFNDIGAVRLGTDYDDDDEEIISVSHLDNKTLKVVFFGLLEAVKEKLL